MCFSAQHGVGGAVNYTVEAAATADGGTLTRWTPLRAVGLPGQLSTAWAGECPSLTFLFISFPLASGHYGYTRCHIRLSYKQYFFQLANSVFLLQ
jgi:hypothetical protein